MKSEIINGKSTIIVVDHLLFTNGLTGILEDIGLKVHSTFSNAKDAITYLKNQNVDIIFSDINMPRMDGIQFCKRLKKLKIEIEIEKIEIEDKSFLHKIHNGHQDGKFHLKLIITSDELKKLNRIESNKKVYKILNKEIIEYIHSLQILIC